MAGLPLSKGSHGYIVNSKPGRLRVRPSLKRQKKNEIWSTHKRFSLVPTCKEANDILSCPGLLVGLKLRRAGILLDLLLELCSTFLFRLDIHSSSYDLRFDRCCSNPVFTNKAIPQREATSTADFMDTKPGLFI